LQKTTKNNNSSHCTGVCFCGGAARAFEHLYAARALLSLAGAPPTPARLNTRTMGHLVVAARLFMLAPVRPCLGRVPPHGLKGALARLFFSAGGAVPLPLPCRSIGVAMASSSFIAPRACGVAASARAAGAAYWLVGGSVRSFSGRVLRASFGSSAAAQAFATRWAARLAAGSFSHYPFIAVRRGQGGVFVVSVPVAALRQR
jgi:hypothetical protein